MNEYDEHLTRYEKYWMSGGSDYVSHEQWGDRALAESYLQKYWLPKAEYDKTWRSIQEKVFLQGVLYPEMVFRPGYEWLPLLGGCLYVQSDFEKQRKVMKELNEQYFVIVQVDSGTEADDPLFRMKYPATTTWDEMSSGNYISSVLLEREWDMYFVFGARGDWGMLVNGGYRDPAAFMVFRPELSDIFRRCFPAAERMPQEYVNKLPPCYQTLRS